MAKRVHVSAVVADRPQIPYGILPADDGMGLMPWHRVEERMRSAYVYWVSTVDEHKRPHAIPVWGLWFEGAFYFSNGETTRTGRGLAANPAVSVHLDGGEDVVIVEGAVERIDDVGTVDRLNAAYAPKYVWTDRVEGWYVLRAEKAFAWLCPSIGLGAEAIYAGSATRWRFP